MFTPNKHNKNGNKQRASFVNVDFKVVDTHVGVAHQTSRRGEKLFDNLFDKYDFPDEIIDAANALGVDRGCMQDLMQDLSEIRDGCVEDLEVYLEDKHIVYPGSNMHAASVLDLGKEKDPFVDMLMSTYKSTNRSGSNNKMRITLINIKGRTIVFEFVESEIDYWHFVRSIRQVVNGTENVQYNGCCRVPNKDLAEPDNGRGRDSKASNAASTPKPRRESMFGGMFGANAQQGNNSVYDVEIRDNLLILTNNGSHRGTSISVPFDKSNIVSSVTTSNGTVLDSYSDGTTCITLDLLTMKCMALSADYDTVKKYMLAIDFTKFYNPLDAAVTGGKANPLPNGDKLQLIVHSKSGDLGWCKLGGRVLIPLTPSEVMNGVTNDGPVELSIYQRDEDDEHDDAASVVGDHYVPFGSFVEGTNSSNSATVNNDKVLPNVLLDSCVPMDMPLRPKSRGCAARIFIRSADGLIDNPLTNTTPSPYCVVYLLNEQGEKLTNNSVERRTSVVSKSNNPEWNCEILLQSEGTAGVEDASAVFIKIRDANGSNIRNAGKHAHLGQATVPISCFLDQVEANLTLPLDYSYRMQEMMDSGVKISSSLGTIQITTELVHVRDSYRNVGDMSPMNSPISSPSTATRGRTLSIARNSVGGSPTTSSLAAVNVNYSLIQTSPYQSWWGCRVLSSDDSELTEAMGLGRPDHDNDDNDGGGDRKFELFLGYDHLYIRNQHAVESSPPTHPTRRPSSGTVKTDGKNSLYHSPIYQCLENKKLDTQGGLEECELGRPSVSDGSKPAVKKSALSWFTAKKEKETPVVVTSTTNTNSLSRKELDCLLELPYLQLLSAFQATESVLLIKVLLHVNKTRVLEKNHKQRSKPHSKGSNSNEGISNRGGGDYPSVELELLVAPCPALELVEALLERRHLHTIRSEIRNWVKPLQSSLPRLTPMTEGPNGGTLENISTPTYPPDDILRCIEDLRAADEGKQLGTASASRNHSKSGGGILSAPTAICCAIEGMIDTCTQQQASNPINSDGTANVASSKRLSGKFRSNAVLGSQIAMRGSIAVSGYTSTILLSRLKLYHCLLRYLTSGYIQRLYNDMALVMASCTGGVAGMLHSMTSNSKKPVIPSVVLSREELMVYCATRDVFFMNQYNSAVDGSGSGNNSPVADGSGNIRKLVEMDLVKASVDQPLHLMHLNKPTTVGGVRVTGLSDSFRTSSADVAHRLDWIVDYAVCHVRSYILMHNSGLLKKLYQSQNSNGSHACEGYNTMVRLGLQELIRFYHVGMRSILLPLMESKDAFNAIPGEELRTGLVKHLVAKNCCLENALRPILTPLGFLVHPSLPILDEMHLENIIAWYGLGLITDLKTWLSKTLVNASTVKEKNHKLPWDIVSTPLLSATGNEKGQDGEGSGTEGGPVHILMKYYISTVPETFRKQLNVYLELCTGMCDDDGDSEGMTSSLDRKTKEAKYLFLLNEKIVGAIAKALIMLSDEYEGAIQSKHWAAGATDEEITDNMAFLISVANDTYRLRSVHTTPILHVPTVSLSVSKIVSDIRDSFQSVHDHAVVQIIRVIFADIHVLFLDFPNLWLKDASAADDPSVVVGTMVATLKDYFNDLQYNLHINSFAKAVSQCGELLIIRYLSFIKELAKMNHTCTELEMDRLRLDIMYILDCFIAIIRNIAALAPTPNEKSAILDTLNSDPLFATLGHGSVREMQNAEQDTSNTISPQKAPSITGFSSSSCASLSIKLVNKLTFLVDMLQLLTLPPDDVDFSLLLRKLSKQYALDEYRIVLANLLTSCVVTVRPDADLDLIQQVSSLLSRTESDGSGLGFEVASRDDLFIRVFRDDENVKLSILLKEYSSNSNTVSRDSNANSNSKIAASIPTPGKERKSIAHTVHKNINKMKFPALEAIQQLRHHKSSATLEDGSGSGPAEISASAGKPPLRSSMSLSSMRHSMNSGGSAMKKVFGRSKAADIIAEGSDRESESDRGSELVGASDAVNGNVDRYQLETEEGPKMVSLVVSKVHVKGLRSNTFLGKANPYCAVLVSQGNKLQRLKTSVKWDCKYEALWEAKDLEEHMVFEIDRNLLEDTMLTIYVYDKDRIIRKRFLGGVTSIKLNNIDVHALDSWFAVDPMLTDDHGGGMDESNHGTNLTTTNKGGNGVTDIGLKVLMKTDI